MTPSQKLARARNSVYAYCLEQFPSEMMQLRETVYIRDGFYRGRRFHGKNVTAVWFADEDQLKIHSLEGECLASWDEAEMDRRLPETGPAALPMRATAPQETAEEPLRRAA